MAMLADDLPLPPELALDTEPIAPSVLDEWATSVVDLAADCAIDVEAAAWQLLDPEAPQAAPTMRWQPDDDGGAEWAMRHLVAIDSELAQLRAQAVEWAERIDRWFAQRGQPLQAKRTFFAGHLERYALQVRDATAGKTKTVVLPSGKVATTHSAAKVAVADPAQLIAWVRDNLEPEQVEEVIQVTEKPLVSQLRGAVQVTAVPTLVLMACGGTGPPPDTLDSLVGLEAWAVGSVQHCPHCDSEQLVAQWLEVRLEPRDEAGRPVPGAAIEAEKVTARVVPGG